MRSIGVVAAALLTVAAACGGGDPPRFRAVATEQPGTLLSAYVASDGTAYLAGGATGGGAALLLRWDGRALTTIPTPDAHAFWWIHGVGDHDMWLAGESGEVHRFDGTTLTRVDAGAPADAILFGVWGASEDDVWVVGGSFRTDGPHRVVRRLRGGAWADVPSPDGVDATANYFKVWGSGPADVWVVGDRGAALRDTGAGLAVAGAPGAERYTTVHGCGPNDVYAVGGGGNGTAVRFDGATWSVAAPADVPLLVGVACSARGVYVGGYFGYVGRLARGAGPGGLPAEPEAIETPAEVADLAIHGVATGPGRVTRVMAVGGDLLATTPSQAQHGFALELE